MTAHGIFTEMFSTKTLSDTSGGGLERISFFVRVIRNDTEGKDRGLSIREICQHFEKRIR